jgi:Domain of unknown function (DUF6259)
MRRDGAFGRTLLVLAAILTTAMAGRGYAKAEEGPGVIAIGDEACRIEFDRDSGGLGSIVNRLTNDACLKGEGAGSMPFRIYAGLTKPFDITLNEKFQLVFDDPDEITSTTITPDTCELVAVRENDGLVMRYRKDGLAIQLKVAMTGSPGVSDWSLSVTNTGDTAQEVLTCFPYLDGVRLGAEPSGNMATAMDQAGVTVPAWERAGGVLGESNQMSMQWHAIWDPDTRSALAIIFMDPDVRPKRLVLDEPSVALHHFPPARLAPGETFEPPPFRLVVYEGDWRPGARAYRAWYDTAYGKVEPPEWFLRSNGHTGRHFKKGGPGIEFDYHIQYALETFRELPAARIRSPLDNWELAFYSHRCMLPGVHTDGDNIVREDMGGAAAMKEGIIGSQRLGLHTTLYVEGYIVSDESDLARTGKAERWAVMQKDGTRTGPYAKQKFHHMCPGCVEWQDHLAESVGRLLRETGADGIRLDSLGFYYLPCYNPDHHHEDPFGYNEWMKQLLAKVRESALAANPDVLLLTEGSADWFGQWFHGALTSRCPRDLTMMRLAVGPFRPIVYASGALWGSLSGFAGGGCDQREAGGLDWNWMCACYPAQEALIWGDVAEDPVPSDPEIVARRFEGDGYWAVVAARPACQDPLVWPRGTTISDKHGEYTLTLTGLGQQVADAAFCDVETLEWAPLEVTREGDDVLLRLETNWALVILRKPGGPPLVSFDPPPACQRGASTALRLTPLTPGSDTVPVSVTAPGLDVSPSQTTAPGEVAVEVPPDALPGSYLVSLDGEGVLGVRRLLLVE